MNLQKLSLQDASVKTVTAQNVPPYMRNIGP